MKMAKKQKQPPTPEKLQQQREARRLNQISQVYNAIAQLLPAEGRDYITTVLPSEAGDNVRVTVRGMTPIGQAFAEHCNTNLRAKLQEITEQTRKPDRNEMLRELANALNKGVKIHTREKTVNNDKGTKRVDTRGVAPASGDPSESTEEHVL